MVYGVSGRRIPLPGDGLPGVRRIPLMLGSVDRCLAIQGRVSIRPEGRLMRTCRVALFALCAFPCAAVSGQDSRSAEAVKSLTAVMSTYRQTAIAAKDPDTGEFVAALFFPDVQLLVVSAPSPAAALLDEQIAAKNFQEVYAALQDASVKNSRVFFQDLGADGLHAGGGDAVDVFYDHGQQVLFDGQPRKHKLSEQVYRDKFGTADAKYARMVNLLLAQVRRMALR